MSSYTPTPRIISHTRMGVFASCPKAYEEKYIFKNKANYSADPLLLGDACHKALEGHYTSDSLSPVDALDLHWSNWLSKRGLDKVLDQLNSCREDMAHIYWRASAACMDKSIWIRNKNGVVPSSGGLSQNGQYKAAVESLGLDVRMADVNRIFKQVAGPEFEFVSLPNVYTQSYEIIPKYRHPVQLEWPEWIEFPISHREFDPVTHKFSHVVQGVRLPVSGELYNGYIDMVAKLKAPFGNGGYVLVDHKTSQKCPSVLEVTHHQQLLKYAWSWKQITGSYPEGIAVNALRHPGQLIIAPVIPELAEEAIMMQEENVQLADNLPVYPKRDPFGYDSPCIDLVDGVVKKKCAFFAGCWPVIEAKLPVRSSGAEHGTSGPIIEVTPETIVAGFGNLLNP